MNNKKVFNALVIDDESVRNETYKNVLDSKFNTEIINDVSNLKKQILGKYDLFIIDICLEGIEAFDLIRDYDILLTPIILVSGSWVDESGNPNEYILRVPDFKNVISVIAWNSFNQEGTNEQLSKKIFYKFCKYNNLLVDTGKDYIDILHISDLQFGGNIAGAASNDNKRIANFLSEENILPDIIVISGDIAETGKKNEYAIATTWIENLSKELWNVSHERNLPDELRNKIIIVPGNHDYDISIAAADHYDFVFNAKEINKFSKTSNKRSDNQKLGFYNFMQFAFKITKNNNWLSFMEKAVHENNIFSDWGIRFVLLNSAYKMSSESCENRFDNFYSDLSELNDDELNCDKKLKVDGKNIYNILIMHNPPAFFRKDCAKGEQSWNKFQTIIEDNHINLILYGHRHSIEKMTDLNGNGGKYCNHAKCISAPCVRLASSSRSEDSSRGFNIIRLKKKDGVIIDVSARYFQIVAAEITEKFFD